MWWRQAFSVALVTFLLFVGKALERTAMAVFFLLYSNCNAVVLDFCFMIWCVCVWKVMSSKRCSMALWKNTNFVLYPWPGKAGIMLHASSATFFCKPIPWLNSRWAQKLKNISMIWELQLCQKLSVFCFKWWFQLLQSCVCFEESCLQNLVSTQQSVIIFPCWLQPWNVCNSTENFLH